LNVGLKALLDGQVDVALREVAQRALREFRKNLALAGSDALAAIVPPPSIR
jgi:hypothetical protein